MKAISTENFVKKYKDFDFISLSQNEPNPKVKERLIGLHQLFIGKNRKESAEAVGRSDEWLRSWVLRFHNHGYGGLTDKPRSGAPPFLTKDQEIELQNDILDLQEERKGGRLTAKDIHEHVNKKYNVNYQYKSIFNILERLELSWISSRSKHPYADDKKQEEFKNTFKTVVEEIKADKKKE